MFTGRSPPFSAERGRGEGAADSQINQDHESFLNGVSMKIPVLPLLAMGTMAFATWHVVQSQTPHQQALPPIEPSTSPFTENVAGAGVVESRSEDISVASLVPGVVKSVAVREGDRIAPGAVLFEIDAREIAAELAVREAELKSAEAELARWQQMPRPEELPPLRATVEAAEARLREAEDVFNRRQQLVSKGASTEEEFIRAQEGVQNARAQLKQAQAQENLLKAGAWQADIDISLAKIEDQRAQVEQFRTELERRSVRAPVDAKLAEGEQVEWQVLQVNIRPGEFVSTPPTEPMIVLGDTGSRRIRVDIDEHDLSRFRPGTRAAAFARGNGEKSYPLRFVRVDPYVIPKQTLTGDNSERVDTRVLQVLYEFIADPADIYVGQQMDVYIATDAETPARTTASQARALAPDSVEPTTGPAN